MPHGGSRPGAGRKPVHDPSRVARVTVRLSIEQLEELKKRAEEGGVTQNKLASLLLGRAIKDTWLKP